MIATAFLTLWASLYSPIYDGDIWFHLLYGKQIFENHTLTPDHTIYSWSPSSNDHIYCAWLGEAIYYLAYKCLGLSGIIILRYLAATTFFLTILHLARQRNTLFSPVTWLAAILCILIINIALLDKPEAISFALMAVIVWNWFQVKQLNKKLFFHIYLFPILILIWVNTHGVFLFGCLFLLCVGIGETLNQLFYPKNALPRPVYYHLLLALFLSLCVVFVTPYGYDYIHQLVTQHFDKQLHNDFNYVLAYQSTFEISGNILFPVFADTAILLLAFVFMAALSKRQLDFVPVLSNILFAFLFTTYVRLALFWIPLFALSITYYCAAITLTRSTWRTLFFLTVALVGFSLSGWIIYSNIKSPPKERWLDFGVSEEFTMEEEAEYIQNNFPNATLGTMYNHGAYILWKLWPTTKVMMDARYFPYKEWCNEYFTAMEGGEHIEQFIQKYPFEVIEIKHGSRIMAWFHESKDWQLAFYGKSAAIFIHSSLPLPQESVRGQSLNNILGYAPAMRAFNTTLLFHDWTGTDMVLGAMKRHFTSKDQQLSIAGLEYTKIADQKYEQKDYTASVHFLEQAMEKKVVNQVLYAKALFMKALADWNSEHWDAALKSMIKSIHAKDTFITTYNLALMAWNLEIMQPEETATSLLTNAENEVISKWREALQQLVNNKDKYPADSLPFIENAKCILDGRTDCKKDFIEATWQ